MTVFNLNMRKQKSLYFLFFFIGIFVWLFCETGCDQNDSDVATVDSVFIHALHLDSIPFTRDSTGLRKAINYVDSVYFRLKSPGLTEKLFRYDRLCFFYYKRRHFSESISCCDTIISLIENADAIGRFPLQYAGAFFSAGDNYARMGNFSKAYECFFNARNRTQLYVDSTAQSDYTYRIAMSLYREGQYNESIRYFKICIKHTEAIKGDFKYTYRSQELLNNVGLCFAQLKQPDSALMYYNLALAKIKNVLKGDPNLIKNASATGVVFGNMGKAYMQKGDTVSAETYFKRNIKINLHPFHDTHDAHFSMLNLADLYIAKHRFKEAKSLLQRVGDAIDTFDYQDTREYWLLSMGKYSKNVNDFSASAEYLKRYIFYSDSVKQLQRSFNEMDVRHYIAKLENEEENKFLKAENRNKQLIIVYSIAVVVFLLLLFLGGVFLYNRSRDFVRQLTELNRTIELQKSELEQRNKDKDQIMRIVAHDLRNPIWGINALSQMVLDEMQPNDVLHESVGLINNSSKSTLVLINELLEATMGIGETIDKKPDDIFEVINKTVQMLRPRAAEKSQSIVWECDNECIFNFNAEKVSRVLSNLIFNAIKFSPTGSKIDVSVKINEQNIIVKVRDYGVGVPKHLQEKVFEMFTSAKREGTAGEKSFGLGLSICKTIAEAHGGNLWLESIENKGTTFFLLLPIQ